MTIKTIKIESTEDLIRALTFIPCTYTVQLSGHGGEVVMGEVRQDTFDYFDRHLITIDALVDDVEDLLGVPEKHQIFTSGNWFDCDDLCHETGVDFTSSSTVKVFDEKNNEVWTSSLDPLALKNIGCRVTLHDTINSDAHPAGTVVFIGQNFEKGKFFQGDLVLTQPFDYTKLEFSYVSIDKWEIGCGVEYDDEYIENEEIDVDSESTNFDLIVVGAPLVI